MVGWSAIPGPLIPVPTGGAITSPRRTPLEHTAAQRFRTHHDGAGLAESATHNSLIFRLSRYFFLPLVLKHNAQSVLLGSGRWCVQAYGVRRGTILFM